MGGGPRGWAVSLGFLMTALAAVVGQEHTSCAAQGNVYDFQYTELLADKTHKLDEYSGKVLLVTNLASFWGMTPVNYPQFNDLQTKYGSQGFEVLGFPSNDFGLQEPGSGEEIWNCIKHVRPGGGYEPNFQLSSKVDVNGKDAHPLFKYLQASCDSPGINFLQKEALFYTGLTSRDIRWNFEKFLIGKDGVPVYRFDPMNVPSSLEPFIEELLAK